MKGPDEEHLLQLSAYREAARAVAGYLLHRRFEYIAIEPGERRPKKIGNPEKMTRRIPSGKELAVIRREYVVALSGPVAEAITSERCEFEDILPFLPLSSNSTQNNCELELAFWKTLFVETKLLLYNPRNWKAVLSLTSHLLEQKSIPHRTARELIKQAIEDYDVGIRDGISALHHQRYVEFVKKVNRAKARFRQSVEASMRSGSSKHGK